MRTCAKTGCEVEFEPTSDTHVYCEPRHAKQAQDARRRKGKTVAPVFHRECALSTCDVEFDTKQPQKIFCSDVHQRAGRRHRMKQYAQLGRKLA